MCVFIGLIKYYCPAKYKPRTMIIFVFTSFNDKTQSMYIVVHESVGAVTFVKKVRS